MFGIDAIILAIVGGIAWITGGTLTTRHEHIERQKDWLAIASNEVARGNRIDEVEEELRNMKHGICNLNYKVLRSRGCDCSKNRKWRSLHEELDALQEGGPVKEKPNAPYHVMLAWPAYAFHNFVTPEIKPEQPKAIEAPEPVQAEPLIDMTQEYNPYRVFKDDPFGKELREGWARIKEQADAELAEIQKSDPLAFASEVEGEKISLIDGDGHVVSIISANTINADKIVTSDNVTRHYA